MKHRFIRGASPRTPRRRPGFTLVELLVVIGIIALLVWPALRKRPDYTPERYRSRFAMIYRRLDALAGAVYNDFDARRLAKRIYKHRDHLFTFLDRLDEPSDNNGGEREIRPAVQMRKNILGNRSHNGAHIQGVLMSIFRTLKLRGHDPTATIVAALREMLQTGKLPPLPAKAAACG